MLTCLQVAVDDVERVQIGKSTENALHELTYFLTAKWIVFVEALPNEVPHSTELDELHLK